MKKVSNIQIAFARTRLANKLAERALRLAMRAQKQSGNSFQGLADIFTQDDANSFVVRALNDEMKGLPMPPPLDSDMVALSGIISTLKKGITSASKKLSKVIHSTMKKISPTLLGAIVATISGPAGPAVSKALSAVASKYAGKKLQQNQINQYISKAKGKIARSTSEYKFLPLGVSPEQATILGKSQLPPGMDMDRAWHIFEQAKLIGQKITPQDAYIIHYHSYQKTAPSIRYTPPEYYEFAAQLKDIKEKLQRGDDISQALAVNIMNNPIYTKVAGGKRIFEDLIPLAAKSKAEIAKKMATLSADKKRDELKARSLGMSYDQYMKQKRLMDLELSKNKQIMELSALIPRIEAYKVTLPAQPFIAPKTLTPTPPPAKVTAMPVKPVTPATPAKTAIPVKTAPVSVPGGVSVGGGIPAGAQRQQAVKTVVSPQTTEDLIAAAKVELKKQGIEVNTPETENLLRLQIEQLQQQVGDKIAQGQPIIFKAPEGEEIEIKEGAVTVKKEGGSIMPLILGGAALLLLLQGG